MKMHNHLIKSASSYVGKQIRRHKRFCKVTDKMNLAEDTKRLMMSVKRKTAQIMGKSELV